MGRTRHVNACTGGCMFAMRRPELRAGELASGRVADRVHERVVLQAGRLWAHGDHDEVGALPLSAGRADRPARTPAPPDRLRAAAQGPDRAALLQEE